MDEYTIMKHLLYSALFFINIFTSVNGQSFSFFRDPLTSKAFFNDSLFGRDSFTFVIDDFKIRINDYSTITKWMGDTITAETGIDFGYMYYIYNVGYLVQGTRIYFLFFIRENSRDYAALYSFKKTDLSSTRRVHLVNSFNLKSHELNGNRLKLIFDNKTYTIDLRRDLKPERSNRYIRP